MADVFISYARTDQGFARDLNNALQKLQRDTWIDWRSIPDSAQWRAEIFAAIEAADNFLFIISPNSLHSWMCGQEAVHAVANRKRIVTILYHLVEHDALLPGLKEIQWINYPQLGFEETFQRLVAAIDTDLDWVRQHTQLGLRAEQWKTKGRDESFLLRGTELREAIRWLEQAATIKTRLPTEIHEQYIQASKELESEEEREFNPPRKADLAEPQLSLEETKKALRELVWERYAVLGAPEQRDDWPDVFVLMPSTPSLHFVYEDHIKRVAATLKLQVGRGADFFRTGDILRDTWSAIQAARVIIADCTGRNASVFYEIGLAHATGKKTVLISQAPDDIPFDLRHLRTIYYEYTPPGMKRFEKVLTETVRKP
jgi:hypothetical protein